MYLINTPCVCVRDLEDDVEDVEQDSESVYRNDLSCQVGFSRCRCAAFSPGDGLRVMSAVPSCTSGGRWH